MKKLWLALFLMIASLTPCLHLQAQDIECDAEEIYDFFDASYGGDEDEFWLPVQLPNGFEFNKSYDFWKLENGLGCEISCIPTEGYHFYLEDDFLVEKIELELEISNTPNRNKVSCSFTKRILLKKIKNGRIASRQNSVRVVSTVHTPQLDLDTRPQFELDSSTGIGYIVFTNAFPYSETEK